MEEVEKWVAVHFIRLRTSNHVPRAWRFPVEPLVFSPCWKIKETELLITTKNISNILLWKGQRGFWTFWVTQFLLLSPFCHQTKEDQFLMSCFVLNVSHTGSSCSHVPFQISRNDGFAHILTGVRKGRCADGAKFVWRNLSASVTKQWISSPLWTQHLSAFCFYSWRETSVQNTMDYTLCQSEQQFLECSILQKWSILSRQKVIPAFVG